MSNLRFLSLDAHDDNNDDDDDEIARLLCSLCAGDTVVPVPKARTACLVYLCRDDGPETTAGSSLQEKTSGRLVYVNCVDLHTC